jgi:hypothetical protein
MKKLFVLIILVISFSESYCLQLQQAFMTKLTAHSFAIHTIKYDFPACQLSINTIESNNRYYDEECRLNLFTISPIGTSRHDWSEFGNYDISLAYERVSASGNIGFKIPIYYSINNQDFFINPVFKIYGSKRRQCKYAWGPQFVFGLHNIKTNIASSIPSNKDSTTLKGKQFGIMFNNSLNVSIGSRFYMGAELGIGAILLDSLYSKSAAIPAAVIFPIFLFQPSLIAGVSIGIWF